MPCTAGLGLSYCPFLDIYSGEDREMIRMYLSQSGPTLELNTYQCQSTTLLMLMGLWGKEGTMQHSYSEVNPPMKITFSGNGTYYKEYSKVI